MNRLSRSLPVSLAALLAACAPSGDRAGHTEHAEPAGDRAGLTEQADQAAEYALATYGDAVVSTLADLLAFKTVHQEGLDNAENPEFRAMTAYLEEKAADLGLEFEDHGAVVVLALGDAHERLGVVTHGDVQPADPAKWADDPFRLDLDSEPGRLVGRGVEDDKGPIAAALYAMKAVKDRAVPLERRIELVISYTEESDWEPFTRFLSEHPPPQLNVALDAEYPVVTAEKGWGEVHITLPADPREDAGGGPRLASFTGGAFLSQIPGDARAVVAAPTPELQAALAGKASDLPEVRFDFVPGDGELTIEAQGVSAHSSKPWDGKNAITHLAALLGAVEWPDGQAARMVRLINDLVGTGDYAEQFGEVAYEHPFMGPLTLSLTKLDESDGGLTAGINIRRPAGRSNETVDRQVRQAVEAWQARTGIEELEIATDIYDPHYLEDAPHIPVLLDIFRRYTGREDARPLSIGGGTHARLMPSGVNFGPAMPGEPYTGHSEHEYMERDQFLKSLEMYTAMLVELAGGHPGPSASLLEFRHVAVVAHLRQAGHEGKRIADHISQEPRRALSRPGSTRAVTRCPMPRTSMADLLVEALKNALRSRNTLYSLNAPSRPTQRPV